jgi:ribonuclease HI
MTGFALFMDVSLDPRLHQGIGGYLLLPASCLSLSPGDLGESCISEHLVFKRFEETSSTRLEVQTVLWALQDCRERLKGQELTLYTDSQCVQGLGERRPGLEANAFLSRKTHRPLRNASLYREFFALADEFGLTVAKVAGHTRARGRDTVETIFSLMDREVRKALRRSGIASGEPDQG